MKSFNSLYLIILAAILFNACSSNPLDIKIDKEIEKIDFINVDQLLLAQSEKNIRIRIDSLETLLGDILLYEISQNIRTPYNDSGAQFVADFYKQDYIKDLEEEKNKLESSVKSQEEEMITGFSYLAHHFENIPLPHQIFYINKLFSRITCTDSNLSIGLENYIPSTSNVISTIPEEEYHNWQRKRMHIQFLKRDVLLSWIQVHLFHEIDGKFAEHLIQAGKILYILNATLPKASEAYILRYNDVDYQWASENEEMIWDYIVRENLLFQNDMQTRVNFLNEGPTTIGLPHDAPDRIGQFIGYKIVKSFMRKNKSLSLPQLLETEYNKILQTYEIQ